MGLDKTLKALSDKNRRKILLILRDGRLNAGEILKHFDMSGATLSYHLSVLKESGLITEMRKGNFIYYELNTSVFEELMRFVIEFGGQNEGK